MPPRITMVKIVFSIFPPFGFSDISTFAVSFGACVGIGVVVAMALSSGVGVVCVVTSRGVGVAVGLGVGVGVYSTSRGG